MASTLSDDELLSINPQFAGLFRRLSLEKDDVPSAAEVVDDYEAEQETIDLQNSGGDLDGGEENADDSNSEDDEGDEASAGLSGLEDVLKNASKGITEGTEGEYRRSEYDCIFLAGYLWLTLPTSQMAKCSQFLIANKLIPSNEPFFSTTPCANAPLLITAWIMDG